MLHLWYYLPTTARRILWSIKPVKKTVLNIKNMSHIKVLNKAGLRIKPCGTPDKISSRELKMESTLVLCLRSLLTFFSSLINNPEVNSRKIYQGHKHAVMWLTNHDKDNRLHFKVYLATLWMLCFCQWYLSQTQASLISTFACHARFKSYTKTLIRHCQRILKVPFVRVSQYFKRSWKCTHGLAIIFEVSAAFLETGVILANF